MMPLFYFTGSEIHPISRRDASRRYYRDTDAGIHDDFIVEAANAEAALQGAQLWLRVRADDGEDLMPDGLHLHERLYNLLGARTGGHIILQVDCD